MRRILGQPRAIGRLVGAWNSGRLHHAWILAGPRGVGKFTTAVEFAKCLLQPGADPGGLADREATGEAVRLIDAGTHPDMHIVRKELALYSSNPDLHQRKLLSIPLDVLREWVIGGTLGNGKYREAAVFKTAVLGHGKIFIIDEAELLDTAAQNALLKTLEEPPPRTFVFLVTTMPQRLLPTIRSRCQLVSFGPLDEASMDSWMADADIESDETERRWIRQFAAGSPGIALLAAQYGFAAWHASLAPMLGELDRGDFPVSMGDTMAKLVDEFAVAWTKRNDNASKDAANKDGAKHLLTILATHARRRLSAEADTGGDGRRPAAMIELIREAEYQLDSNVNMKLVLENLVAQWAAV